MRKLMVVVTTLIAVPAVAQEVGAPARPVAERYEDVTKIDFDKGVDVIGETVKPSGVTVIEPSRGTFAPMVPIRSDFGRELRASIDAVK